MLYRLSYSPPLLHPKTFTLLDTNIDDFCMKEQWFVYDANILLARAAHNPYDKKLMSAEAASRYPRCRHTWARGVLRGMCFISCLGLAAVPASAKSSSHLQIPDWLEHWEFGINVDENEAPSYFLDPIVPLYLDAQRSRVVFAEPRLSHAHRESLLNAGLGLRQLVANRSWLLGGNMFYDYETRDAHSRIGWGAEALSAYAEFRSNAYLGLSQERVIEESAAGTIYERAASGFDMEAGMPVPYYSRLKVFMGYYWYEFEKFKNPYGWRLRTEYTPFPFVVIDGLVSNDTKSNLDWGMTVALRIPFGGNDPRRARSPLRLDETAFPESDASEHLFRLVERKHEIVVERRQVTGGVSVEVGRGT